MSYPSKIHNPNKACCTIAPVASDYKPQGTYKQFASFQKAYFTGPTDTDRALLCIFDIFGFWPQTLQGADYLAKALNALVVMPDFFEPTGAFDLSRYPPKTDEDKAAIQSFFGGIAKPDVMLPKVRDAAAGLKALGKTKVAAYGFCWGGKIVTLAGAEPLFDAVACVHPAMLTVADAENLSVPLGLFPSKDEPLEEFDSLVKAISSKPFAAKNSYKVYPTMHHGWAAARADLETKRTRRNTPICTTRSPVIMRTSGPKPLDP